MNGLPFFQVDAFAHAPFTGNPAAVIPLEAWLPDGVMQSIAAENNLSETAFAVPATGDDADYELRWFSPRNEVALCGHATLAAAHVLMGGRAALRFATRHAGILTVERDGDGYALSLPARPPVPMQLPEIARAAGGAPVASLWHPHRYAVLVYGSEAEVRALAPDFAALAAMGDILTIATAPGDATDIVTRAFAPGAGVDEDPVTGSAHAVIAPYWAARLGRTALTAFQASWRGGRMTCRVAGDRVILGGACVTVIEGRLFV